MQETDLENIPMIGILPDTRLQCQDDILMINLGLECIPDKITETGIQLHLCLIVTLQQAVTETGLHTIDTIPIPTDPPCDLEVTEIATQCHPAECLEWTAIHQRPAPSILTILCLPIVIQCQVQTVIQCHLTDTQ